MTATSATVVDPAVLREAFLDAAFSISATLSAALGIPGRALYDSLVPMAEEAALSCVAAAAGVDVQGDGEGSGA